MRITFDVASVETLEYLRTVNTVLRNNKETDANIKAFAALKELVESLSKRLDAIEASERRNKVCR